MTGRYLFIDLYRVGTTTSASISDINVFGTGSDLASRATAYSRVGGTPSNAVDGNPSTAFNATFPQSDGDWLIIDLGNSYAIQEVQLTLTSAASEQFVIYAGPSTTGPWTYGSTRNGLSAGENVIANLSLVGEFVWIEMTGPATSVSVSIPTVNVFGV